MFDPAKWYSLGLRTPPPLPCMVLTTECIVADIPEQEREAASSRRRRQGATRLLIRKRLPLMWAPSGAFLWSASINLVAFVTPGIGFHSIPNNRFSLE